MSWTNWRTESALMNRRKDGIWTIDTELYSTLELERLEGGGSTFLAERL